MSAKTVTIDHPHAEVIAAYYSGKAVQTFFGSEWQDVVDEPSFSPLRQWRIKPEPLVRWIVLGRTGAFLGSFESRDSAQDFASKGERVVRMVEQPE